MLEQAAQLVVLAPVLVLEIVVPVMCVEMAAVLLLRIVIRQRANDAGYKACAAAGGVFRIQYHSIDEIDCLIDTFPVWDNPQLLELSIRATGGEFVRL